MHKKYLNILLTLMVIFVSACNKKKQNLPEALNLEAIQELLPEGKPILIGDLESKLVEYGLVDIQSLDESIMVELKYSSTDNFLKKDIYGTLELAYLQPDVAKALVLANELLKQEYSNLRLLVYDAARPLEAQYALWEELDSLSISERKQYVADPIVGSIHNFGCAVDLTIYDLERQRPLDMGTHFDYFGHLAYPRLERQMLNEGKLTSEHINNRLLLRNVMIEAGFMPITSEWWHFNYLSRNDAKLQYELIK